MAKAKILIVEDDPFSVQLLRHNLKNYPAEILPVSATAEDALKIALEYEPDVALVDIYLAGDQTGIEASKAIQDNFDIPIIYLTGYSSEEVFQSAKATDPFGYLLKPFTPKELTVTLDMALYKHSITKELRSSRATLSTTLEALSEAVITTDPEWKAVYANSVAQKWLGLKIGESVDEKLKLSVPQTQTEIPFDPSLFADAHGPVCSLKTATGESFVRVGVFNLPKPSSGYVVVLWDITAEYAEHKEAEGVFDALESLEEGLLLLHPQSEKILFASRGFERMTGWTVGEVKGETLQFLFGSKGDPVFWESAKSALSKGSYFKAERPILNRDGKSLLVQWQISRMAPSHVHNEGQLIVFLRDVTFQRQTEEELRQSQKIEAVGRLAGGVAHDFNNLLSVINSYSDLLTLKLPEGDPLVKYVANIRAAGQRAGELVAKLLTFSRRDAAKPSLLDAQALTDELHKMLRRVIRENIEIAITYGENLPALWADQLQIEQILMNLCVNARDAIAETGRISVKWDAVRLDELNAHKRKVAAGDYLLLSVSDTGSGIDPAILEHIFDPYFTTKSSSKGTGLGLSIVYSIVQQLKGCIEVESEIGKGTTFRMFFPASDRAAKTKTVAPIVSTPEQGNESVLIVEDEESFSDCLQSLLTLHGYKVLVAKDAASAEELFSQALFPVKLLLSDLVLPDRPGHELAATLKKKNPELKIIFITGYDNALQILQDFPYASLVLQKPFSVVSILNKIRDVLDTPQTDQKIQLL